MTRTQLGSWLFASGFCFSLALSHQARAAHPDEAALALPTLPKAEATSVKRTTHESSFVVPSRTPALRLASPSLVPPALPPVNQPRERLILGMRLPTFIAFGLGGLSAGGAVATGFAARRGNDPSHCDQVCTEQGVTNKALMLTTGILTGMAAVGVTVGITLMLKAPTDPKRDAIRPRFALGLSGEKAVAKVGWAFSSF